MSTRSNHQGPAKAVRWAGRIIGFWETGLNLAFFLVAMILSDVSSSRYIIFTTATLAVGFTGCFASWWRDWLAGVLLILAALGTVAGMILGLYDVFAWLWVGLPFLAAGVLFLFPWQLSKSRTSALP